MYLKLAFPKTRRKVKSGSTGVLLLVYLGMLKENDLTTTDTRSCTACRECRYVENQSERDLGLKTAPQTNELLEKPVQAVW